MKRQLLRRVLGIMMAGMLFVESGVPAFAVENIQIESVTDDETAIQSEEIIIEDESDTQTEAEAVVALDNSTTSDNTLEMPVISDNVAETSSVSNNNSTVSGNTPETIALESIALSQAKLDMAKGTTADITVLYTPDNTTEDKKVTWQTSNAAVVTVAAKDGAPAEGVITAVGVGTATITAMVGEKTAVCDVTVGIPLDAVTLDKTELTMLKGVEDTLTVSYLPEDTTEDKTVEWTSSHPDVVAITPMEGTTETITITALTGGVADITAKMADKIVTCKVTVSVPLTGMSLSTDTIELAAENGSKSIEIALAPEDTTDRLITYEVKDSTLVDCSVMGNVLTVASKGVLGETEIIVQAGGKTAVLKVCVVVETNDDNTDLIPVNEVVIDKAVLEDHESDTANGALNLQLEANAASSAIISAKVYPTNATNQTVSWTSSNSSVATVTETEGVVTVNAKGVGSAVITATADNGISDSINVVVARASYQAYISNEENVVLYCNTDKLASTIDQANINRTHQIIMEDAGLAYEYYSSDTEIATVDATGIVTAKNPGKATITALNRASGSTDMMSVEVRRLVETIELPMLAGDSLTVLQGTETVLPFSVLPEEATKECLTNTKVTVEPSKTLSASCEQTGTEGVIRFTANKVGETASLIIEAGDSYAAASGRNISVVSARRVITVHVVSALQKIETLQLQGTAKMLSGTEQTLGLKALDMEGYELSLEQISVGYVTSNEKVVSISADGKVKALKGGTAVITACALDGSNKTATFTITVEQRPTEIVFDRAVYGVSKAASGKATLKLKPTLVPAATAKNQQGVAWTVSEVRDASGKRIEGNTTDYFAVKNGTVSIKKAATVGMQATILCKSTAYNEKEAALTKSVIVQVQPKKVSKLKFNSASKALVGLKEHTIPFTATLVKGSTDIIYTATSSNAEVAEVTGVVNGEVVLRAHKYGTVTLTVCADNAITATCKVTVYPVEKGTIIAKESVYLLQQAQYDANDKAVLQFVDAKTQKKVIDSSLFTYKSSNPALVYVDEKGVAYANPKAQINEENCTAIITATLKDDPDKRFAQTEVMLCMNNQIERIDIAYYHTKAAADADIGNISGKPLIDGTTMKWENGQEFVVRINAYDAAGKRMENPQISFAISDTDIADIKSSSIKTFTGDDNKRYTYELVVRLKKPGKFALAVTAKDQKKITRKVSFGAYDGMPILASKGLGVIHKNGSQMSVGNGVGVAAQTNFILLGANGTSIKTDGVSVDQAKIGVMNVATQETEIKTLSREYFVVSYQGNNEYKLVMDNSVLANAVPGTYEVILNVTRTALEEESGSGIGSGGDVTKQITTTYTITDTMPKLQNIKVSLNTFIQGDAAKLPIDKELKVIGVKAQTGYAFAQDVEIYQSNDAWYVRLKDEKFASWNKKSTSGRIDVTLEGYEKPVTVTLTVATKLTKPVVKQKSVPAIHLAHGSEAYITLVDAKKNVHKDYEAALKAGTESTSPYTVEVCADGTLRVVLKDANMYLRRQGIALKQKITVKKPEWREPVELTVSVKAYDGNSVPKITFAKSALTLNRHESIMETYVETDVKVSLDNIALREGEWTIPATYTKGKGAAAVRCADVFKAEYKAGKLRISLKEGSEAALTTGNYSFAMTDLWDVAYDAVLAKPLTTAKVKISVKKTTPSVTVKMSGNLDIINRNTSTLKGTVTVKNANSAIAKIELQNSGTDDFASKYFCIQKENTFMLYAKSSAAIKAAKTTGMIKVTLDDGTVLTKAISFTPTQSTPVIGIPKTKTIYKSAASQTVNYNFNADITEGARVNKITAVDLPDGFGVQSSNGYLFVTLKDKTLKAGTYQITVDLYLRGAQAVEGNPHGTPVPMTIDVVVKE
ncbi:MAG: Ig-like domain-containing protein [Lachnospiraceae bacterium]|nr:Ig-like domain-containing protein [Lachnospiraceae bacterium]